MRDQERTQGPAREAAALRTLREHGMEMHEFDTGTYERESIELQDRLATEIGATDLLDLIRQGAKE